MAKTGRIFLGRTVNDSTWRETLIAKLQTKDYFNPVVPDWTAQAQRIEAREKARCKYQLYVITPKMKGLYSVAELVDGSNKNPANTVGAFLKSDDDATFDSDQWRSVTAIAALLRQNGTKCFFSIEEIASYFNT